nr:glycosyl hydrolase 53 family protein [uncultured Butyrivibrio sp.]
MKKVNFKRFVVGIGAFLMTFSLTACGEGIGNSVSDNVKKASEADSEGTDKTSDNLASKEGSSASDNGTENGDQALSDNDEAKENSVPQYDDIFVEKIDSLSADFICGMDASSVLVEEASGVKYYDFDGQECDVFKTLSEAGVNCIRLRVWNDPYDSEGHGYGGGNNDVATAIELGKRATEYGMQVMIDFHYSDFWADPKKQYAPKAWKDMTIDEKCDAITLFTLDSLNQIIDAGVNVTFVQIGNEINNGMSGEVSLSNVTKLLDAASRAVRNVSYDKSTDMQIIVHYTNIEDNGSKVYGHIANLAQNKIDYDIVGLSYYPYWHDDLNNMQTVVSNIEKTYGKKVMIVETAYPYTSSDGDGSGNSIEGKTDICDGYSASIQGQAHMIRDIMAAANDGGAVGVCYWEGVWIPVGSDAAGNASIWNEYGSGWASKYAADYDPDDAGKYYGGCSWDNQAMFDFHGYPLPSLNVFKYVYEGHTTDLKVESVPDINLTCKVGEDIELPQKANVIYNDPSYHEEIAIVWDEKDLDKLDTGKEANITLHGTLENEEKSRVICYLEVKDENFVINSGFEDEDRTCWNIEYKGAANPTDYQDKKDDAHDGTVALHFWSKEEMDFSVSQEITDLEPGIYRLECYAQGGDVDNSAKMELFCDVPKGKKSKQYSEEFMVTSWAQWKNPVIEEIEVKDGTVTIGVHIRSNKGSWGTVDEFILKKVE